MQPLEQLGARQLLAGQIRSLQRRSIRFLGNDIIFVVKLLESLKVEGGRNLCTLGRRPTPSAALNCLDPESAQPRFRDYRSSCLHRES